MELIDNGGYRFWDDNFSIQSAYEDCKTVFDGITDAGSYQECDTGIILYHAHEIMYALKTAALSPQRKPGRWIDEHFADEYLANCSECGYEMNVRANHGYFNYCPNCGAYMKGEEDGRSD